MSKYWEQINAYANKLLNQKEEHHMNKEVAYRRLVDETVIYLERMVKNRNRIRFREVKDLIATLKKRSTAIAVDYDWLSQIKK